MERYESLGLVGEGSYGTVLKCRHRDSGRLVAIKKFMDSDDDKTVKKIALREIKLLRQLHHENLVNLLEVWRRRRRWFLVFEFVERTLLSDLEQNPSGLDLDTSRQNLFQILRATDFCHQHNIIHRDIKPENILISQGGVVKLCDFGFARTMVSPAEVGVYTDYVATRWYRAPELLVGDTKYSKPVDVWAVGCLLIEMLTGQPLFPGDSDLDQIHHIVRFFGNLTSHHQELFYRNPVFSGVRLPECPGKIPLEQRFPSIPANALDLAQDCLQMDPERRAQCSELLEHPLFTHDSFQIRFLDELNAKIQKDHRENSTLPKITKASKRERVEEDERNRRGKDKKQSEDGGEKVMKRREEEKIEKTNGKQPPKLAKTIRNTSEPSVTTKQPKTLGAKVIDNAAKTTVTVKNKAGKTTGAELRKEPEISQSAATKTDPKDLNNPTKPKHGRAASLEPTKPKHTDTKDMFSSCSDKTVSSKTTMTVKSQPWRFSNSEPRQEVGESWSNTDKKDHNTSKNLTPDDSNRSSAPNLPLESPADATDTNISQDAVTNSGQTIATNTNISKTLKMTSTSENPDTEQRKASDSPKVLSSNPKPTKTTSNFGAKPSKHNTSSSTSLSKTLVAPMETQKKGIFNPKLSKTGLTSTTKPANNSSSASNEPLNLPPDREDTRGSTTRENQQDSCNTANEDIKKDGSLEMSPATNTSEDKAQISQDSGRDPEFSEPSSPSTSKTVGSTIPKTIKVSDKENREDLASSVNHASKVSRISGNEQKNHSSEAEPNTKVVKHHQSRTLVSEPKTKLGSLNIHTRSVTKTPKTLRMTFPPEANDTSVNTDTTNLADSTSIVSTATPDHRSSTRNSVFHPNVDSVDLHDFDFREDTVPPPPSSTPLLLHPSISAIGTTSPAAGDHLSLGSRPHPGTHSLKCIDKLRHLHGGVYSRLSNHVTGSLTAQALSARSATSEQHFLSDHCNLGNSSSVSASKRKSDVHFPDLRSSALPDLRGREGKYSNCVSKDQRKDKHPVAFIPPSEPQQQGHNSSDTNKP